MYSYLLSYLIRYFYLWAVDQLFFLVFFIDNILHNIIIIIMIIFMLLYLYHVYVQCTWELEVNGWHVWIVWKCGPIQKMTTLPWITWPSHVIKRSRFIFGTKQEKRATQQGTIKHKLCIKFVQCWTNVEDVGPTLYKCFLFAGECDCGCLTSIHYVCETIITASTKHLYNICTMSCQRTIRWHDVVQMLYKCLVLAGPP